MCRTSEAVLWIRKGRFSRSTVSSMKTATRCGCCSLPPHPHIWGLCFMLRNGTYTAKSEHYEHYEHFLPKDHLVFFPRVEWPGKVFTSVHCSLIFDVYAQKKGVRGAFANVCILESVPPRLQSLPCPPSVSGSTAGCIPPYMAAPSWILISKSEDYPQYA